MIRPCRKCGSTTTERTKRGRCKPCYNASCRASKARRWEQHKVESRDWARRNSAKITAERRRRRHEDAEYAAAVAARAARIRKAWRQNNPAAHAAHQAARRAMKVEVGGRFTQDEWVELCDRFGWICLACGDDEAPLTADHVVPLSKRGPNTIENIQPLCAPCNSRKGTNIIDYRLERIAA